ncbi:hypothetical protein H2200_006928 [Cladophialophora chaetospira]|uniref:Uncharacterized protein n=1 Tax=Cladophialophora chaetospira TaxID=386627 RepID=A0AA38X945_9EURO|nr:hypothetical protein H2200_006928 [Cladophialophora chaetospira]
MATTARRPLNTNTTYTLAHTVQCKLKLAANRPDRNLRFVLGHAFTLDNLMLRIVEIENKSAKSQFEEAQAPSSAHAANEHYDCSAANPVAAEPEPAAHNDGRGRRISFQDNNARPSSIGSGTVGVASNNPKNGTGSPARKRSPPPVSIKQQRYLDDDDDDDGSSSDDYDEPESYQLNRAANPQSAVGRRSEDAYSDEEDDAGLDDDDGGLGLTRFESASAAPPRMVRSSSSSSSEEEDDGPVTPPQLPADVDINDLLAGEKSAELADLYESVRGCSCHGHREHPDKGRKAQGFWDVPVEKSDGRHLAVVAVEA